MTSANSPQLPLDQQLRGKSARRRVLHVLGALDVGGIETWLLEVARQVDRDQWPFDFMVNRDGECDLSAEIRDLGCRIFHSPPPRKFWSYRKNLRHILQNEGPFDVVHSHVDPSAFPLLSAKRLHVPARIAHSHISFVVNPHSESLFKRALYRGNRSWVRQAANGFLCASEMAGEAALGPNWRDYSNARLHFCGIDLRPFKDSVDRGAVRESLGLASNDFVIGHVGRYAPDQQKNHAWMLPVLKSVLAKQPSARLMLLGDGPGREAIEKQARELGVADRVMFMGLRRDVPTLLLGAMDVFLFPSLFEGLGLALVEAQAAGLPAVISENVPAEADIVPGAVTRLSLTQSANEWADALIQAGQNKNGLNADEARQLVSESPFNVVTSARKLTEYYDHILNREYAP